MNSLESLQSSLRAGKFRWFWAEIVDFSGQIFEFAVIFAVRGKQAASD